MPAFRPLTRTANTETAATFVDDAAANATGKTVQVTKVAGAPTAATIDLVALTPKPPTSTGDGTPVREFVGVVDGVTFHLALVGDGDATTGSMISRIL